MAKHAFYLFFFCFLVACGSPKAAKKGMVQKDFYECKGNEPYWSIKMEADVIIFTLLGGGNIHFPYTDAERLEDKVVFKTYIQDGNRSSRLQLTIVQQECMDAMSGETFPYTVTAEMDGETYTGCAK